MIGLLRDLRFSKAIVESMSLILFEYVRQGDKRFNKILLEII